MKIYAKRKVEKLFDAEGYTAKELKSFFKNNETLKSRVYENTSYFIQEGEIKLQTKEN